jgi:hypothetical protein
MIIVPGKFLPGSDQRYVNILLNFDKSLRLQKVRTTLGKKKKPLFRGFKIGIIIH